MINPINETVSISANAEALKNNANNTAQGSSNAAKFESVAQTPPKSDGNYGSSENKKSDRKDADQSMMKGASGEVRKSDMTDGKLTINVYDSSGKLLRQIPPGYLPVSEQKFDITV